MQDEGTAKTVINFSFRAINNILKFQYVSCKIMQCYFFKWQGNFNAVKLRAVDSLIYTHNYPQLPVSDYSIWKYIIGNFSIKLKRKLCKF